MTHFYLMKKMAKSYWQGREGSHIGGLGILRVHTDEKEFQL